MKKGGISTRNIYTENTVLKYSVIFQAFGYKNRIGNDIKTSENLWPAFLPSTSNNSNKGKFRKNISIEKVLS